MRAVLHAVLTEDLIRLPFCIEGHCNRWNLYQIFLHFDGVLYAFENYSA